MRTQTNKVVFKPTKLIWEALNILTNDLAVSETYTGKWTNSDTMRYLLMIPYVSHSYPSRIRRLPQSKAVNMTELDYQKMIEVNPTLEDESGGAYGYRLIVSGLIHLGYLNGQANEEIYIDLYNLGYSDDNSNFKMFKPKRLPRKIDLLGYSEDKVNPSTEGRLILVEELTNA